MSGLRVIHGGAFTTVQDLGRPCRRGFGVPLGGAFDVGSHRRANALTGNRPEAATFELTMLGGTYEALGPLALALAGASMDVRIERWGGDTSVAVRVPSAFSLREGDRLVLGGAREGVRAYLAVHGGWRVKARMGSGSSEVPLAAGDLVEACPAVTPTFWLAPRLVRPLGRALRVVVGPDAGDCPDLVGPLRVGVLADRMGIRLECEASTSGASQLDADRLSTPVAPGAIQWTGAGWIVLGVAAGTMGGYPVAAQVIRADLDELGQLRPGDRVGFQRVSLEEAIAASRSVLKERQARELQVRGMAQELIRSVNPNC